LSLRLAEGPYLMGERPCGTDATAFGVIAGILTPFFDSPLRRRTQQLANLSAYVERMMAQYYPDYPWSARALAA
jgi:glutathione S-transferase